MFGRIVFIILVAFIESSLSVSSKVQNETAESLRYLLSFALQGRQNFGTDPYLGQNPLPEHYSLYQNIFPPKKYPILPYAPPYSYEKIPDKYYFQNTHAYPTRPIHPNYSNRFPPPTFEATKQSVMEVLYSLAKNDDLQCVPKIICEVTAGAISGRQGGTNIPIDFNMESLIGLLSAFNGIQSSPLLYFGKAALLGYSSKSSPRACDSAYPDCPSEPDRLVQYLNNHNGGFFRYFNGINPQHFAPQNYAPQHYAPQHYAPQHYTPQHYAPQHYAPQHQAPHHLSQHFYQNHIPIRPAFPNVQHNPSYQGQNFYQNYKPNYDTSKFQFAEQRIQNKPGYYGASNSVTDQKGIAFPNENSEGVRQAKEFIFPPMKDHFLLHKTRNQLKFPEDENYNEYPEPPYRKPKELPFDLSFYHPNDLDLQRPLPNHKASQMIFPDRTGTGQLRLDVDEVDDGSGTFAFEDGDIRIKLKGFQNGFSIGGSTNDNVYSVDGNRIRKGLSFFPSR